MVIIQHASQVPELLAAPRAIVLVAVQWSPWPQNSRKILAALEETREHWAGNAAMAFFELQPEQEEALNRWYEQLCHSYHPRFELHGHGYGPFWWMANGVVRDCLAKPYERRLQELQQRSRANLIEASSEFRPRKSYPADRS